jgi:hypothetical protein
MRGSAEVLFWVGQSRHSWATALFWFERPCDSAAYQGGILVALLRSKLVRLGGAPCGRLVDEFH